MVAIFAILLLVFPCFSQELGIGVFAVSQIQLFGDSESAALANAAVAYKTGAFSPLSNPAGLAGLNKWEISFSRIPTTAKSRAVSQGGFFNQKAAVFGLALPKGFAVGVGALFLDFGDFEYFDSMRGKLVREPNNILQWQGTLAKQISWLTLGASVKYEDRDLGETQSSAWMFDVGAQIRREFSSDYLRGGWLSAGISIKNLSSGYDFRSEFENPEDASEPTLKLMRLGIAGGTGGIREGNPDLMATLEYQRLFGDYGDWEHLLGGVSFKFLRHLNGRVGYNLDLLNEKFLDGTTFYEGFTYGLSFRSTGTIQLEIAYGRGVQIGDLNVHTFGLTLRH